MSDTITVRQRNGAYETQTVRGERASCTHSAEEAARRLGSKLFGEFFLRAEPLPREGSFVGTTAWRLHATTEASE